MKLIIAGGRNFADEALIAIALRDIGHVTQVLCGDAKGADLLGAKVAEKLGIDVEHYPAQWKNLNVEPCVVKSNQYGEYNCLAGHNRNSLMRDDADGLLAFWDGKSRGTKDMITKMKQAGKFVKVEMYV